MRFDSGWDTFDYAPQWSIWSTLTRTASGNLSDTGATNACIAKNNADEILIIARASCAILGAPWARPFFIVRPAAFTHAANNNKLAAAWYWIASTKVRGRWSNNCLPLLPLILVPNGHHERRRIHESSNKTRVRHKVRSEPVFMDQWHHRSLLGSKTSKHQSPPNSNTALQYLWPACL